MREDGCKLWHVLLAGKQQTKMSATKGWILKFQMENAFTKVGNTHPIIEKYNANVIHTPFSHDK
jgi:hypothetical protein